MNAYGKAGSTVGCRSTFYAGTSGHRSEIDLLLVWLTSGVSFAQR